MILQLPDVIKDKPHAGDDHEPMSSMLDHAISEISGGVFRQQKIPYCAYVTWIIYLIFIMEFYLCYINYTIV